MKKILFRGDIFQQRVENLCFISLFALYGSLLRILFSFYADLLWKNFLSGLETELDANYIPNQSYLLSLFLGCFALSLVNNLSIEKKSFHEDKSDAEEILANSFLKSLKLGITTGFCGSLTTLSTWVNEATEPVLYINEVNFKSSIGLVYFAFKVILIGCSISFFGFILGISLNYQLQLKSKNIFLIRFSLLIFSFFNLILYFILMVIVALHIFGKRNLLSEDVETSIVAVIVSPFGALFRYYLSTYNKVSISFICLGTFLANIFGSVIFAFLNSIAVTLNFYPLLLNGLNIGFCGSLTTVSTLVDELYQKKIKAGIIYFGFTMVISYILMVTTYAMFRVIEIQ